LNIKGSGLSNPEFTYALKGHFDFVVAEGPGGPARFAVEFDGPTHDTDLDTIHRDLSKNHICQKLGMPFLRIDAGYLRRIGRFTLVGWLTELWFMYEEFLRVQAKGDIDPYEVFNYAAFFCLAHREGDKLIELKLDDPKIVEKLIEYEGRLV